MPQGLQKIVDILPLTQGIKLLKAASLGLPKEGVIFPIIMMCLLALLCIGISIKFFRWE
jgi:ABC-2 type transport system permease protein